MTGHHRKLSDRLSLGNSRVFRGGMYSTLTDGSHHGSEQMQCFGRSVDYLQGIS